MFLLKYNVEFEYLQYRDIEILCKDKAELIGEILDIALKGYESFSVELLDQIEFDE